jgi:lysophospholipase L1-like esterase
VIRPAFRCAALATLLAAVWPDVAAAAPGRTDAPKLQVYRIILVGDSTMAPNSGWGGAFCAHHVKWKNACLNLARGARSTRSYRQEGAWDVALAEMKVRGYLATYVLIQMGHNDQAAQKPERWTDPMKEYPDNLRRFVTETRAAGAVPVLMTPLSRREFVDGKLDNTLALWAAQVRKVAQEMKVPLIDMNARAAGLVQGLGPVASMEFAQLPPGAAEIDAGKKGTTLPPPPAAPSAPDESGERAGMPGARGMPSLKFDYTHLGPKGAEVFAAMVADGLANIAPEMAGQLIKDAPAK